MKASGLSPKALVTGGLGFIGSVLVRQAVARGYQVRVLDNGFRGKRERLPEEVWNRIELVEGDITDPEVARRAVQGMDYVFHLAAINGTRHFYEIPHEVLRVNLRGILNMLEAAQNERCKRFLFSSTSELYHLPDIIPTPENVKVVIPDVKNPRYSYAGSKAAGELLCMHQDPARAIPTVVIRYHNIYGPDMGYEHVIPELLVKMHKATNGFQQRSGVIEIQGDGEQTRAFCSVQDAVEATIFVMENGVDREIYHIGTQEEITVRTLITEIQKILGIELQLKQGPLPAGGTLRRCPDVSKLKALGYVSRISLQDGLREVVESFRSKEKEMPLR